MPNSVRLLIPAVAAFALAAPAADARPAFDPPTNDTTAIAASAATHTESSAAAFDWESAAVGAGGITGLVVLLSGGALVVGRARVSTTR